MFAPPPSRAENDAPPSPPPPLPTGNSTPPEGRGRRPRRRGGALAARPPRRPHGQRSYTTRNGDLARGGHLVAQHDPLRGTPPAPPPRRGGTTTPLATPSWRGRLGRGLLGRRIDGLSASSRVATTVGVPGTTENVNDSRSNSSPVASSVSTRAASYVPKGTFCSTSTLDRLAGADEGVRGHARLPSAVGAHRPARGLDLQDGPDEDGRVGGVLGGGEDLEGAAALDGVGERGHDEIHGRAGEEALEEEDVDPAPSAAPVVVAICSDGEVGDAVAVEVAHGGDRDAEFVVVVERAGEAALGAGDLLVRADGAVGVRNSTHTAPRSSPPSSSSVAPTARSPTPSPSRSPTEATEKPKGRCRRARR